jgi:hypothetical protein
MIVSEKIELNPGFKVEGVGRIVGAKVQLLSRQARSIVESAIEITTDQEIRDMQAAKAQQVAGQGGNLRTADVTIDPLVRTSALMRVQRDLMFKHKIHCFITEDGQEINGRDKIDVWVGLLVDPDEEELVYQMGELERQYQRSRFRPRHTCSACGAPVDCSQENS